MRINKFISDAVKTSRRGADRLIEEGKVIVNGKKATVGMRIEPGDDVRVNGNKLYIAQNNVYIALNKPIGITSTTEKDVPGNLTDLVHQPFRVFNIGRLDKESDGLILMTNDGDIVNDILRPEHKHEKEYIVAVDRPVTDEFLEGMASGVPILNTITDPCKVEKLSKYEFNITLTQGLNRQIRRMCEVFGYEVVRLQRHRVMNIHLGNLPTGHWRYLSKKEKRGLFDELDYTPREW